jgi:pantoate--beta-alanine ligase
MPDILHSQSDLDRWRAAQEAHSTAPTIALVPTMGALHDGHLALVRRAREMADLVVVSIFVNPRQFGAGEDFDKYPRTLDADVGALEGVADAVFAPTVDDVYPREQQSPVPTYTAGAVGDTYEGAARPGHFDGMLTVVARLFAMVKPDVAVFGQKDAQQVFLVRRLIADHFPDIALEVMPTVREPDGLAMSSRNRFLSAAERTHALVLSRALALATHSPAKALPTMRALIESEPGVVLDYVDAVDASTFEPVVGSANGVGAALTYIVAAHVGGTRLLDTVDVS